MNEDGKKGLSAGGVILLAVAALWLYGSFKSDEDSGSPTDDSASFSNDASGRPGSPEVYRRIETMTNCNRLQREFDIAGDNADREQDSGNDADVPISYMNAADNRMQALGCYG